MQSAIAWLHGEVHSKLKVDLYFFAACLSSFLVGEEMGMGGQSAIFADKVNRYDIHKPRQASVEQALKTGDTISPQ